MSKGSYLAEAYRQLLDTRHYCRLESDPTPRHAELVAGLVQEMFEMNHIDKGTLKYLTPTQPQTARFYHLPKIHKVGNPGRPIVSSCRAPTKQISEYVDHHLRPLVVQIPSYLRDTTDFLRKLLTLEMLPPGSILVTLDVSSLYTNIPHNEGVAACREALETRQLPSPTHQLPNTTNSHPKQLYFQR